MQLARDSHALDLLCANRAPRAFPALVLQPGEHLVERRRQRSHVRIAALDRHPLPRLERIDAAHEVDQTLQRRERPPQEQQIGEQRHDHRADEDDQLGDSDRRTDGRRRDDVERVRPDQDRCVDEKRPPSERSPRHVTLPGLAATALGHDVAMHSIAHAAHTLNAPRVAMKMRSRPRVLAPRRNHHGGCRSSTESTAT